ncbi:MFS transporter [Sphingomonas sp. MG17]|uniref:MFS transporter n=1 Tax=Sphingomonas tagetis TaxID=2949092 RepID=A0A9X2HM27_9SPHN|nr:MFS transporter [Sphingomonas tagetis]MCP3732112.1 MFS transporter [Sphingomonas tagetis]
MATVLNYYDRNLIGILVQGIKLELGLSDGQIGLLSGLAFALVYSVVGIPIAFYADRSRRVSVLGVSLLFWSIATALCGAATSFATLYAARLAVGVGEAGGSPTIHALTSAYAKPQWRARAMAAIAVASGLGISLAAAVGGYVAEHCGWRAAFVVAAIPGIGVGALVLLVIREPVVPGLSATSDMASMRHDLAALWRVPAFRLLCIGYATVSVAVYATLAWTPAFLMRAFALSPGQVGAAYGTISALGYVAGGLGGGVLSDLLARRDARWPLWLLTATFVAAIPSSFLLYGARDLTMALMMLALHMVLSLLWAAPMHSMVQNLAGDRLRALAASLAGALSVLVGFGLGPYLAGLLSDHLTPAHGARALGLAMIAMSVFYAAGAAFIFRAAHHLEAKPKSTDR